MRTAEAPTFDVEDFNESFFAEYEQQLSDISVEDQASEALKNILAIENEDGSQKTYAQLRDESRAFFANEWVRRDEELMDRLAREFAAACLEHNHGAELVQDEQLRQVFERGMENLFGNDKDEYTTDPITGKRVKKSGTRKKKAISWFWALVEENKS